MDAEVEDLHGDDAFAGAVVDVGRGGGEERWGPFSRSAVVRVESTIFVECVEDQRGQFKGKALRKCLYWFLRP